jgi:hypothetical protein
VRFNLTVDSTAVDRTLSRVGQAFADVSQGPMRVGLAQAGLAYLGFARRRFQGEGYGTWRPLAQVTVKEREWLGFPGEHPILKRLGVLERALTRGAPGNRFEHDHDGVLVGFGGAAMPPGYLTKSGKRHTPPVPIATIAAVHQNGARTRRGYVPPRRIIVRPDQETIARMRRPVVMAAIETVERATGRRVNQVT